MSNEKESFEECMKRLFRSINPNATWKSINRLDLFEILFNDQQKKLEEKDKRIAELETRLEGERDAIKTSGKFLNEEKLKLGAMEKQNAELRGALEFYADKGNWTVRGNQLRVDDSGNDDSYSFRYGHRARQTLAKFSSDESKDSKK